MRQELHREVSSAVSINALASGNAVDPLTPDKRTKALYGRSNGVRICFENRRGRPGRVWHVATIVGTPGLLVSP